MLPLSQVSGLDVDPKGDNPKAGADVGKIVNLMAADANRIAMITSGMYFLYGGKCRIYTFSSYNVELMCV